MIKEMLQAENKDLALKLEQIHAHDLAQSFLLLNEEEKTRLFRFISDEKLSELMSYLEPEVAADILVNFKTAQQKAVVEIMEPDDVADILQAMDESDQQQILSVIEDSHEIQSLIQYDEEETGSVMTHLVIKLTPDLDVKVATKTVIKLAPEVEAVSTLFVVDNEDRFLGVIPLKKLLKSQPPLTIQDLYEESPFVYDHDSITYTVYHTRNHDISEMPVLNKDHQLLGMVTLDDVLDVYHEEATEDFEKLASLPETIEQSAIKTALSRVPWLLLLLLISTPIALITTMFEETLAMVAILVIFQPLILDTGGNVATQTLAVTLKMYVTNEEEVAKNAKREIMAGLINGLVIGLIAFLTTLFFASINPNISHNAVLVAFVVGFSLWLTVIFAPIVGFFIPTFFKKIKVDPASASGPLITTVIDVVSLVIYFGTATLLLM